MKKFELFMGCLGNGITVCNKAVEEHGDYKKVCHISEHGKNTVFKKYCFELLNGRRQQKNANINIH